MARALEKMGKNAKLKERQKWSNEKPKLNNARRLRGIYFIDPEDKEFKDTIKNARKKLETPMAPTMPCKTSRKSKLGETRPRTLPSRMLRNLQATVSSKSSSLSLAAVVPPLQPGRMVPKAQETSHEPQLEASSRSKKCSFLQCSHKWSRRLPSACGRRHHAKPKICVYLGSQ